MRSAQRWPLPRLSNVVVALVTRTIRGIATEVEIGPRKECPSPARSASTTYERCRTPFSPRHARSRRARRGRTPRPPRRQAGPCRRRSAARTRQPRRDPGKRSPRGARGLVLAVEGINEVRRAVEDQEVGHQRYLPPAYRRHSEHRGEQLERSPPTGRFTGPVWPRVRRDAPCGPLSDDFAAFTRSASRRPGPGRSCRRGLRLLEVAQRRREGPVLATLPERSARGVGDAGARAAVGEKGHEESRGRN